MSKRGKMKISQEGWRTTRKQRAKYYIADLGRTCEGALVTTFMTMFLLMQGMNPGYIAGVMLAVKIIDSFDDVIFGFLVDKIKIANIEKLRKIAGTGKYLPWYRLFFWVFPIFTVLFFMMPVSISTGAKLVWFGVFYLLYDLSYTFVEVPMNSMALTLTDNLDERNVIIQNKSILSNGLIMVIGIVFYALVSEVVGLPIKYVVIGASVVFLLMMMSLVRGVSEQNAELANVDAEENARYSFRDMLGCLKTNKYFMVLIISSLLTTCLATGGNLATFVSYYHFGNSMVFAIPIAISLIPGLIAQLNTAKLTKKFGKVNVIVFTGLLGGVAMGSIFFVGSDSLFMVCALMALQALPGNVSNIAKGFLIPDTIEYTRYKTGKDCSGIFFAMNSFVTKLTQGVASSLGLFLLGLAGWVEIEATDFADIAAQGIEQTPAALDTLWLVYTLIPSIGVVAGVLTMVFYRLRDKDVALMAQCNAGEITREDCEKQLSRKY